MFLSLIYYMLLSKIFDTIENSGRLIILSEYFSLKIILKKFYSFTSNLNLKKKKTMKGDSSKIFF